VRGDVGVDEIHKEELSLDYNDRMDPLAHALAGTLIARTHPSRSKGLVTACLIGAVIPDIDIVLTFWGKDNYLLEHRGFTHSLMGLLPMSFLAACLAYLWVRQREDKASFWSLWSLALAGVVSHILLDLCTSWGTMVLWPNRTRFAWDELFIVDPWYWGLLAIPLLLSFFWKDRRVAICVAGMAVAMAYHGMAWFNHRQALRVAEEDRPQAWKAAFPQPLSPFRWSVFDRGDGLLKNARVDFLKGLKPLEWEEWKEPALTPEVRLAMDSPRGKNLFWFARVPMWSEEKLPDGSFQVSFWDMRFNTYLTKQRLSKNFGGVFTIKDGQVVESRF